MKKDKVDCLLVAYSGFKFDKINEFIEKHYPGVDKIERQFNAAIGILGTSLNKNGFSFDYINSFEDDRDALEEKLSSLDIMSVGISTTFCNNIDQVSGMVEYVRMLKPDMKIILGGPFIVEYARIFFEDNKSAFDKSLKRVKADFIIDSFNSVQPLSDILSALKSNLAFDSIANIFYKKANEFIYTFKSDDNVDLSVDTIDWSLFESKIGKIVPLRTSLSCPFACTFCNFPVYAGKYKFLDVDAIEKDLNEIRKLNKVEYIHFIDDTFNFPKDRFKKILKRMIKNKYDYKWFSQLRCQFLDPETIILMKESGCQGVYLGIESGNNDVLKIMNKCSNTDDYKKGISLLNRYGIPSIASFILGFPGETLESVKDTKIFIEEAKPTFYCINPWSYIQQTPINKEKFKYQIIGNTKDWSHKTMDYFTSERLCREVEISVKESIPIMNTDINEPNSLFQMHNEGINIHLLKQYLNGNN